MQSSETTNYLRAKRLRLASGGWTAPWPEIEGGRALSCSAHSEARPCVPPCREAKGCGSAILRRVVGALLLLSGWLAATGIMAILRP